MPLPNSTLVVRVDQQVPETENVVWALYSAASRTLVCRIYPAGPAFEVQVGFHKGPTLRTELVATERAGRALAETLKTIALTNGFLEATTNCCTATDRHI